MEHRIELTCSFVRDQLYNPVLRLVREMPSSNTYPVASDNLLAQKALEPCDSQIAASVWTAIATCCQNGYSLMHEALLEVKIPLPIHTANVIVVANSSAGNPFDTVPPSSAGNHTVFWERHNGTKHSSTTSRLSVWRDGGHKGASQLSPTLTPSVPPGDNDS